MVNDICRLCDLDREICSCRPAPVSLVKRGRIPFPTRPQDAWADRADPNDFKEEDRW